MKTLFWLGLALFLVSSAALNAQKSAPGANIFELKEALAAKMIDLRLEGKGGHQGEAIRIICKNLKGKYFRLRIPQGQLMEPRDTAEQTLVVAQELLLAVTPKTPVEGALKTFCTQSGDLSPSVGSVFAVGSLAPAQVCELLKFLGEKGKIDGPDAQTAVWCLTSKASLGSVDDPDLRRFIAGQLGKNVPEYHIRHSVVETLPGRPAELGKALLVEGNFSYTLEKDERVVMVLLNEKGELIKQVSKEEIMKAGQHRSGMKLEVYNLDPGKYTLRMKTRDGRVIKDMSVEF